MAKEFLRNIGSTYGRRFGVFVRRAPVLYEPSTGTDMNDARLPPREEYCDMQLAFRQLPRDPEALARATSSQLLLVFLFSLLASIGAVLVGPFLPAATGFVVALIIGVFLAIWAVHRERLATPAIVLLFLSPTLALLLLKTVALITVHRLAGAIVFGIATFTIFTMLGTQPFVFFQEWLYTHPRLRPESRANAMSVPLELNQRALLAFLGIAIFVPMFSPSLAILAVIAVAIAVQWRDLHIRSHFHGLVEIFGVFVSYGCDVLEAPGVWFPKTSASRRTATIWLLGGSLFLALAIGLDLMCPWDLVSTDLTERVSRKYKPENPYGVPYAWILPAIEMNHIWLFAVAVALLATVPVLVLTAIYHHPIRALAALRDRVEGDGPDALDNDGRCEWQWYVDRLCSSPHVAHNPMYREVREAEHLFLGVGPNAEYPVLLDKSILGEHSYMVGETGSGKTALGIMPLLIQLIRGHAGTDGQTVPPPAIVILDLKGDNALFQTVKHEMLLRRDDYRAKNEIQDVDDPTYAFRHFTPEKNMASHYFNPFDNLRSEARTDIQLCHLLLDALNLNHGEGYGRSYYSRRNRMLLFDALSHKPKSMEELYDLLKKLTKGGESSIGVRGDYGKQADTFELVATIHALTQYEMLATTENITHPAQSIHMPELIEQRQVAYFWLPAALESISVREIGKLALFSLLSAAIDRSRRGEEPRQVYLVIDEFQRIAGENFKVILEQARSFGISAILANQTQSDLKTHDVDLRPTIRTNTRMKMFFGVTDPEEARDLSESSGEELAFIRSASTTTMCGSGLGSTSETLGWTHSIKPRLTRNDIIAATDDPLQLILHVSRGAGYTQFGGMPQLIRTTFPLSREEYDRRMHTIWPKREKHTVEPKKSPQELDREAAAVAHEELEELFAEFDA